MLLSHFVVTYAALVFASCRGNAQPPPHSHVIDIPAQSRTSTNKAKHVRPINSYFNNAVSNRLSSFKHSVGYVGSWSNNRKCMLVEPEEIDASAYTSIVFSYAGIDEQGKLALNDEKKDGVYLIKLIDHLSRNYPSVKIIVSVGGYYFNSQEHTKTRFSRMVEHQHSRETFINSAWDIMKQFGLDGIDFDWEFPGFAERGGREGDAENYVLLVKEMRAKFRSEYSISLAIPDGNSYYIPGINAAAMAPYVDFMTVMAYELHGIWEYDDLKRSEMLPHTSILEIDQGMRILIESGIPKEKLLLGLAFWGRAYKQSDPTRDAIGSSYVNPKLAVPDGGMCTGSPGYLGYNEIAEIEKNRRKVRNQYVDNQSLTNVMTYGVDQWVTYDSPITIMTRVKYANMSGFGGVSALFIDLDDKHHSMSNAIITGWAL